PPIPQTTTVQGECHDPLPTPGTQPWPWDSSTPRTTPTPALGPDRYPANSPGHHRPSPPVNTTSHRHSQHPPAITAMTATSAPGLGYHTTSAPAPPIAPGLRRDPHHAS
ncbi:hypothetical protein C0993_003727, partial [Termitomyces sp. T159_Od127]